MQTRDSLILILLLFGLALPIPTQARADTHPLRFSTYFGGAEDDDAYAMAIDAAGNAIVAGATASTDTFPILNAFQPENAGGYDVWIARFQPDGQLLSSTFLGGSGRDVVNGLTLDPHGNIIVVGFTRSLDLPFPFGAFQEEYAGGTAFGRGDGFILKLDPTASRVLAGTYFGGSGDDALTGVTTGPDGSIYVCGETDSADLPLKNPLQPERGGGRTDVFIARFDPALETLHFSTFLGGSDQDDDARIALDPAGYIYVCGTTYSTDFPVTAGALQTVHHTIDGNRNPDAFVAKLTPDGQAMVYSTYFGHAAGDSAYAIAADAEGHAYFTGEVSFLVENTTLGFQPVPGFGGPDAYVAKLRPDGSGLVWFSYLAGTGDEAGYSLVLDADNNIYVTGITDSRDFPVVNALQPRYAGGRWNAFVAKISHDGQQLLYSSYLGGSDEDWGFAVAVDPADAIWIVGQTRSTDFPVRNALQPQYHQPDTPLRVFDAFVMRLQPFPPAPTLNIQRSGTDLFLTWPTNHAGFKLESTDTPGSNATWTLLATPSLILGGHHTVIEQSTQAARFYRLHQPGPRNP